MPETPVATATHDDLLAVAVDAARAAGRFLVEERPARLAVSTKSSPTDVVTEMDTAAERLIEQRVRASRPVDTFLGEEGGARSAPVGSDTDTDADRDAPAAAVRWVVDPIDGTVNYLYGIPAWAVSIAAEVDGEAVVGVVFNPSLGELFTAVRGRGATLDGSPIAVSSATDLSRVLVATGFGYDRVRRAEQAATVARVLPRVADMRRMGAASLDLCAVACGRVDAYYERGLKPWDHAAAALIAREAGARVEGRTGGTPDDDFVLAAGPGLFESFRDLVLDPKPTVA